MPRQEIKCFADLRSAHLPPAGQRQVLFAGRKRYEFRMSNDHARGHAGIR